MSKFTIDIPEIEEGHEFDWTNSSAIFPIVWEDDPALVAKFVKVNTRAKDKYSMIVKMTSVLPHAEEGQFIDFFSSYISIPVVSSADPIIKVRCEHLYLREYNESDDDSDDESDEEESTEHTTYSTKCNAYLDLVHNDEDEQEIEIEDKQTCDVCNEADSEVVTCCNHYYCNSCILHWINKCIVDEDKFPTCPTCRNRITEMTNIKYI